MSYARFCECIVKVIFYYWLLVLLILEYFTQNVNILSQNFT
nr:MAG TPA: hypothetical protein [Caudoviricetes sp.]